MESMSMDNATRHGYWVHCKGASSLWHCSECNETIIYNPSPRTYQNTKNKPSVSQKNRYCRACGAIMDKNGEEING